MAKETLSYLVNHLLKAHNISIDAKELEFQIKTHPTYPSLHAITGVLNHFNVENIAIEVPKELETLKQLPKTFLAQIKVNGNSEFGIVTKENDIISLTKDNNSKETLSQDDFLNQFTGIVLAVEKDETTVNTQDKAKTSKNLVILFAVTASIFLLLSILNVTKSLSNITFFILSLVGVYISYAIIKQENGETTALGDAFCSNPTEKKNCNAVLSSKGAKINEFLKISDLSFIYFLGISLSFVILILSNTSLLPVKIISIVALPIILYSVFYQAFIIKKWCALCLSIVAVLSAQAIVTFFNFNLAFESQSLFITGLSFSASALFWLPQSQIIKTNIDLKVIKIKYFKFKRNFELFSSQLDKSPVLNTNIETQKEIIFGNLDSHLNLTIITNPLCGHCKSVHNLMEKLLKQHNDSISVTIRFNVNTKNMSNTGTQIALRLLELYTTDNANCLAAMHDIYNDLTTEQWFKKWNTCSTSSPYEAILNTESQWCIENNINFTPELLLNGRSYPKAYDREDLIYFIEDLEEHAIENA